MKYYYIKHKDHGPIRVTGNGGFTIGQWDGWLHGIMDITIFPNKKLAKDNIKVLKKYKSTEEQNKFVLVKVKRN